METMETTLTHKIAFVGISVHLCFLKKYYQHFRNAVLAVLAVLAVCAKPFPVWGKRGETRGLLRGEKSF